MANPCRPAPSADKFRKGLQTRVIFAPIDYRGHWFWIGDLDIKLKLVFTLMMMRFILPGTAAKENRLLITIPAQ